MNKEEMNNKFFQKLIERYLEGKTTADELKLLVNYYESFQKENEWVEALGPESLIKERILINILEVIKKSKSSRKKKIVSLFKSNIFKYSAAASVALFLTSYFLYNKGNKETIVLKNTIVNTAIFNGSDKAVLTTEDGSNIMLEKGKQFASTNAVSNGEELVYTQSNSDSEEVVYNYLTIPKGGEFFLKLADGTQVWLNSDSKLKYPVVFNSGKTRVVELLYGEAYFDVSPSSMHQGAKFIVNNNNQEIEVLGTEFNIKAYNNEGTTSTTLVHGKVNIKYQGQTYVLLPNQQSILNKNDNTITFEDVDVRNEISWKDGVFSFNNKSLKEIMIVLSRWYDFEVVFQNKQIENEQFVGVLGKKDKIENILANLKGLGIIKDFKFNDKKIIIE